MPLRIGSWRTRSCVQRSHSCERVLNAMRLLTNLALLLMVLCMAVSQPADSHDAGRAPPVSGETAADPAGCSLLPRMAPEDRRAAAGFRRFAAHQRPARPAASSWMADPCARRRMASAPRRDPPALREIRPRHVPAQAETRPRRCARRDARQRLHHPQCPPGIRPRQQGNHARAGDDSRTARDRSPC